MTEREKFEKWFDDNVKNFQFGSETEKNAYKRYADIVWQAAKAISFNLPERMDYELHGDKVINDPFADGYNECLSDVIAMNEEYANSTVSDGWIPVSERLPEFKQGCYEYLVLTDGKVQHDYFNCPFSGGDDFEPFCNHYGDHVTHWMPLPSVPEVNK